MGYRMVTWPMTSRDLERSNSGRLDPLSLASTPSDYGEHHQVHTGSRNYPKPEVLISWQQKQISTQSQWLYLCLGGGKFFAGVHVDLARRFFHPVIPRWRTNTGSSYNFATENDIKMISAAAAMCFRARPIYLHQRRHCPTRDNTIRCKPEVQTLRKTAEVLIS